jgi:hypothetical protein
MDQDQDQDEDQVERLTGLKITLLVDVCRIIEVVETDLLDELDTCLLSLVRMLSKLSRR